MSGNVRTELPFYYPRRRYLLICKINKTIVNNKANTKQKNKTIIINLNEHGINWLWPTLRHYSGIFIERLSKTLKSLIQDNASPGRDLNPETPKYEAGALHSCYLQLQYSIPKGP